MKGDPLRFIHFSGYGATIEKCMNDWLPEGDHPFRKLYSEYSKLHDKNNEDGVSKTPWSYSQYYSGEKIDDKLRVEYRKNNDVMFSIDDPFALNNNDVKKMLRLKKENNTSKVLNSLKDNGIKVTFSKILGHLKNKGK